MNRELAVCLSLLWGCIASTSFGQSAELRLVIDEAEFESAKSILARRVSIQFEEVPLKNAIQELSRQSSVQFNVDRRALEDVGLSDDVPVTASLVDGRLETALHLVLSQLELAWLLRDNLLMITTPEQGEMCLHVRTYPVRDLIRADQADRRDYEQLIFILTSALAPESWDEVGGPCAIVAYPPSGALVISQTWQTHLEIDRVLTDLRKAQKSQGLDVVQSGRAPTKPTMAQQPRRSASVAPPRRVMRQDASWQVPRIHP